MANLSRDQVKDIIAKAPKGTSPAGIVSALRAQGHQLEGYPVTGPPAQSSGGPLSSPSTTPQAPPQDMVQRLTSFLQPAGGMLGGGVGGLLGAEAGGIGAFPGAVAGAGLGGAAGAGLRDLILSATGHQTNPLGMVQGGGTEAAMQLAGEGIGKAVRMGSKAAMMVAAKTADPAVAQTALDEGVAVTKRGLQRVVQRIGASGQATTDLVQQAGAQGQRYDGIQLARNVMDKLAPDVAAEPATSGQKMKLLRRLTMNFLGSKPWSLDPEYLHVMKQKADAIAKPIYDALDRGEVVGPRQQLIARWNKTFADEARDLLGRTIDGYQEQNARTSQLIKLKDTIWPEAGKDLGPLAQMVKAGTRPAIGAGLGAAVGAEANPGNRVQGAVVGGLAGGIAGNPGVMSSAALLASNPYMQFLLKQTPRLFDNGNPQQSQ